jgi:hypothetical protein
MSGGYGDPAKERLNNGRSMADLMRGGAKGLRGVIVAPATPGGIPVNFNPHDRSKITINIVDPDGQSVRNIAVGDLTADSVSRAMAFANNQVAGNDINSIRERAAVAFEELAKLTTSGVKRVPVTKPAAPRLAPPQDEETEAMDKIAKLAELEDVDKNVPASRPPVEQIDRSYSPMAAFGLKKSSVPQQTQSAIVTSQRVPAPQKLIYFEKEGLGTVPAFFHDVIVFVTRNNPEDSVSPEYSGFIVLIYDLRFEQNAARWFPPANDPYQRPWAAQIKDDPRLYLVQTTGFQYVYDNREYCVLNVERAVIAVSDEV